MNKGQTQKIRVRNQRHITNPGYRNSSSYKDTSQSVFTPQSLHRPGNDMPEEISSANQMFGFGFACPFPLIYLFTLTFSSISPSLLVIFWGFLQISSKWKPNQIILVKSAPVGVMVERASSVLCALQFAGCVVLVEALRVNERPCILSTCALGPFRSPPPLPFLSGTIHPRHHTAPRRSAPIVPFRSETK